MDRRSFLKLLSAGALVPFIPGIPGKASATGDGGQVEAGMPPTRNVVMQNTNVAGTTHYDCDAVWRHLKNGDELTLHREPGNPHDYLAIEVKWRGRKLGYVPRFENLTPAILMDQGTELTGLITRLREYKGGRKRIEINVLVAVSAA